METTNNEQIKRLVADVNEATHKKVKVLAVRQGVNLQDWVAEAIAEKLTREERRNNDS